MSYIVNVMNLCGVWILNKAKKAIWRQKHELSELYELACFNIIILVSQSISQETMWRMNQ